MYQTLTRRIFFLGIFICAALIAPHNLRADEQNNSSDYGTLYLRGDLGVGVLDGLGSDDAFALGAGLGYRFNENIRSDITFDYAGEYGLNIPGTEASSFTSLINLYVDFKLDGKITPYIGVGAGFATIDQSQGGNDDAFAWALHSGVSYEVEDGVHLDFGYKYRAVENSGENLDDHLFRFGIRFDLN